MVKFADYTYLVVLASNCELCVEDIKHVRDWASSNNMSETVPTYQLKQLAPELRQVDGDRFFVITTRPCSSRSCAGGPRVKEMEVLGSLAGTTPQSSSYYNQLEISMAQHLNHLLVIIISLL